MTLQLTETPIDSLIPYARNSRTHIDQQVAQIAASIKEFGFTNPVLTDGAGGIIAGHGRVLAAQKLKLATVPTIALPHLTEAQRRAYVIADNRIALNAGWDVDMLGVEVVDLKGMNFDLSLLGFNDKELTDLLSDGGTAGLTDPDDIPDVPDLPTSVLGDVWVMGNHRLTCGSSTDADVVERLLGSVKPGLMVTDPPYGVEYDAEWREKAGVNGAGGAKGKVLNDDRADWTEAWVLFPGDVAYVWHAGLFAGTVADSLSGAGFALRSQIIWAKSSMVLSRGDYHWQHEPCWYAVRKGKTGHYDGGRKQTTLWQIDKPNKSETGHSTQKPVECMKRPIENNSSPGQAVYEPFSGSGTTIIAAEMTGRHCFAVELNPAYIDVAVKRWQAFTGAEATLEGDGRTFADVAAQRAPQAAPEPEPAPTAPKPGKRAGKPAAAKL
jgi:DNA modification methylase